MEREGEEIVPSRRGLRTSVEEEVEQLQRWVETDADARPDVAAVVPLPPPLLWRRPGPAAGARPRRWVL